MKIGESAPHTSKARSADLTAHSSPLLNSVHSERLGGILGRNLDNLQALVLEPDIQAVSIANHFLFELAGNSENLNGERCAVSIANRDR